MTDTPASSTNVRYEPNEKLPRPLALGLGLQFAVLCLAGIVLTPAIVVRAGGLAAIVMTLFVELTSPRRRRIQVEFGVAALPEVMEFLGAFAACSGWTDAMAHRLEAASEETLLTLLAQRGEEENAGRRLLLVARKEGAGAVLEFIATPGGGNVEDRIALLAEQTSRAAVEREVSLRLLRALASSVRHQQYHDTDIVTVHVDAPAASG